MLDDPKIMSAIIAGIVSLVISISSGIYAIIRNKKRMDEIKKELLVKHSVEKFLENKDLFLDLYRKFENEFVVINKNNPSDGTKAIQFAIDFYANHGRDFYLRNRSILNVKKLDELFYIIKDDIDSGTLNAPGNHLGKRKFGENILEFLVELNQQVLNINVKNGL